MIKSLAAAAFAVLVQSTLAGTPFTPWGDSGYRTINAIEFAPDGQSMFIALETARVAAMVAASLSVGDQQTRQRRVVRGITQRLTRAHLLEAARRRVHH